MKYSEFMNAKDRAELQKAESLIADWQAVKRRVMARIRARAYRRMGQNK